ncbi:MAG: iron ABC transporter permease [Puniceicoccales bacterium]|nr:iron ABC transporter permease [Puniceicoccales bacterium]
MKNSTRSTVLISTAIVVLLGALSVASLVTGDADLSLKEIWQGLLGNDETAEVIFWNMRVPRLLVAMLAGAALASSGLVMQAYFRNSLASPGLLGVSSGATAGAVGAIGLLRYLTELVNDGTISGVGVEFGLKIAGQSLLTMPLLAIAGAFIATFMVMTLARSGASTERLLLAGIALNAMLGAVSSYVLSIMTLTYERSAQILFWLMGGMEDRTWEHVWMTAPIVLCLCLLWPLGRPMDLLSLGASEAQSLGVDVKKLQLKLLVLSTVLTALATAAVGTVGFVGLVVPHILRLLVGAEHRRLVPLSIVGGAAFMLACDILGRYAGGLRIGIVTAAVGGPFFLWLLRRK